MAASTLARFRHLIRSRQYVVTTHAVDELEDDGLSLFDLENIVLTGRIIERQRDRHSHEAKFVIAGLTLAGTPAETVVKLGFTGQLIVITVYAN